MGVERTTIDLGSWGWLAGSQAARDARIGATMATVSLIYAAIFTIVFLPLLSVVGAGIWARRLGKRTDVPPFVKWVAYALVVPGAFFIVSGTSR